LVSAAMPVARAELATRCREDDLGKVESANVLISIRVLLQHVVCDLARLVQIKMDRMVAKDANRRFAIKASAEKGRIIRTFLDHPKFLRAGDAVFAPWLAVAPHGGEDPD